MRMVMRRCDNARRRLVPIPLEAPVISTDGLFGIRLYSLSISIVRDSQIQAANMHFERHS